ncbi:MAG: hypothetical protein ABSG70_09325 [Terriglobales bacterium]
MKSLLITAILLSFSIVTSAQEWHSIESSFCSQIKAKGAKVSGRPFSIFEAPDPDSKCCEGLNLKTKGRTEPFGHFKILGLDRGRCFLSFDLKTKQVNVPISIERLVDKRYIAKDCEPTSKITVDKGTNQVKWEEWVIVD